MGASGTLEKMTIIAYSNANFTAAIGAPFTVMINPATYTYRYEIKYNDRQAQGSNGPSPDFNKVATDTVNFDLIFDGTGAVPSNLPNASGPPPDGITKQLEAFQKLVFTYNGKIHSPNFLKLSWGNLLFKCRLKTLTLTYTLFKPDGTPLRAKAAASFLGYTSEQELAKEANDSSPDLSHLITVIAGDTLPTLCARIYGSSIYYMSVAEVNGLDDFRSLVPGTQLLFPPLAGSAS